MYHPHFRLGLWLGAVAVISASALLVILFV